MPLCWSRVVGRVCRRARCAAMRGSPAGGGSCVAHAIPRARKRRRLQARRSKGRGARSRPACQAAGRRLPNGRCTASWGMTGHIAGLQVLWASAGSTCINGLRPGGLKGVVRASGTGARNLDRVGKTRSCVTGRGNQGHCTFAPGAGHRARGARGPCAKPVARRGARVGFVGSYREHRPGCGVTSCGSRLASIKK